MYEYRCRHLVEGCEHEITGEESESVEELALAHLVEAHPDHEVHDAIDSALLGTAIFQIHM